MILDDPATIERHARAGWWGRTTVHDLFEACVAARPDQLALVDAPNRVRILIWERGVGPTHASGTGACASAVAAAVAGGAGRDVDVEAPGGTQRVEWREEGVFLTGWAEVLFEGEWVPR